MNKGLIGAIKLSLIFALILTFGFLISTSNVFAAPGASGTNPTNTTYDYLYSLGNNSAYVYFNMTTDTFATQTWYSVNGAANVSLANLTTVNLTWGHYNTSFADGNYYVLFTSYNSTSGEYSQHGPTYFTIETNKPLKIVVTYPTNASYIGSNNTSINVTTDYPARQVWAYFNNTVASNWTFTNLTTANLTWYLIATNVTTTVGFGSSGSYYNYSISGFDQGASVNRTDNTSSHNFVLDLIKPTITENSKTFNTDGTIDYLFNVTDGTSGVGGCGAYITHPVVYRAGDVTYTGTYYNSTAPYANTCRVNITGVGMTEGRFNITSYAYDNTVGFNSAQGAYSGYGTYGNYTNGTGYQNYTYNYLKTGWNLLTVTDSTATPYLMGLNLSTITYVSWYNNTAYSSTGLVGYSKAWRTYTASAGTGDSNYALDLTHYDAVYVASSADRRWLRNETMDGISRNITIGVPGWNLIGFSNSSLTLYNTIHFNNTGFDTNSSLFNNSATASGGWTNVSIKYISMYNPWNTSYPYRTYRDTYNNTPWINIQLENVTFGQACWVSSNVTLAAGDSNQNLNNTRWWIL